VSVAKISLRFGNLHTGMSRLTKKPISLGKATVSVDGGVLSIKGAKGTLTKRVHPLVSITVDDTGVMISPKDSSRLSKALSGTFASHVKNMISGTEKVYEKKLILEGVGYRMEVKGKDVVLTVGFSHTVSLPIPEGITATADKNVLVLQGADKEALGQYAANIRRVKPPEPYLGKGIRYEGEVILRKQGKKAV
jgi:large subunit ribosomal protein L6